MTLGSVTPTLLKRFGEIPQALPDAELRAQIELLPEAFERESDSEGEVRGRAHDAA
jgi:hypothetical protein